MAATTVARNWAGVALMAWPGSPLLDCAGHRRQLPVERRYCRQALAQVVLDGGGEDRPVGGDAGGDADLPEGGVDA